MPRFYFDHNATTPVSREVLDVLVPALAELYGNASSIHQNGQAAKQALERGRRQVAAFLGCGAKEVLFTGSGTEADNLAIVGFVRACGNPARHVITTAIEHPAVLKACAQLEREGVEVTRVAVGASGVVDPGDVRRAVRPGATVLISVMHANNELGTIQPVSEIARVARECGAAMHSDGVQAAGKAPANVEALGVDLYAISGHKMYAPKGIGALYVRKGLTLAPVLYGGSQERGLRPGTENVAFAVALGRAAEWMSENQDALNQDLRRMRDRFEALVTARVAGAHVNCAGSERAPNTSNIHFEGVNGEPLLIALDMRGFSVSSGAACSSGAVEPSHVLTAIGLKREEARGCLRFSFGRSNTEDQVDELAAALAESVAQLRKIAPAHA